MAWFAFGCTMNAGAAWTLLNRKDHDLRANLLPVLIIACDAFAAIACLGMIVYYRHEYSHLSRMLLRLPEPIEVSGLVNVPVFPVSLYCIISAVMAVTYIFFIFGWITGIKKRSFLGASSNDSKPS